MQAPFLLTVTLRCPGCAPLEPSCFVLSWKSWLCSGARAEARPRARGRLLWQSVDPLSRKSLHPKELEQGVFYFRAALGEALQSSTLPFCHLILGLRGKRRCTAHVSNELLRGDGSQGLGCYSRRWRLGERSAGGWRAARLQLPRLDGAALEDARGRGGD